MTSDGVHSPATITASLLQFFVLCHSLLQLTQLMISGYLKSSISTVEKRFGLSSQISGLLAAFNEVLFLAPPTPHSEVRAEQALLANLHSPPFVYP